MKKIILTSILLLILSSCGSIETQRNESPSQDATQPPMTQFNQTSAPVSGEQIAVITTNKGVIKMKFFPAEAPETTKNFIELSKKGFFNGLTFHRVIPDFMIQGGDPTGTGMGGETYKGPNTTLPNEVNPKLSHLRGAVSMANKGGDPATATSQFFIVQNPTGTTFLDGDYTIFGQVFEGFETVDAIANVARDSNDKPLEPVTIESIIIQ